MLSRFHFIPLIPLIQHLFVFATRERRDGLHPPSCQPSAPNVVLATRRGPGEEKGAWLSLLMILEAIIRNKLYINHMAHGDELATSGA